jgi:hypothetical protein
MARPQRILTLAFLRPSLEDHWVNRLSASVSKHPFCHVELYFESLQQSFSIMWGETAGFRAKNLSNPNYSLISLSVTAKEYDTTLEFCRSAASQNLAFDDRGMWSSWVSPPVCCYDPTSQQKGATFCSKIITEALQFGEIREANGLRASFATPSRLYESVFQSGRVACTGVPFKRQALMTLSTI